MNLKRLFLIDGHSLLYRSYYAIQKLSNSAGFPTNAIYGFINTLKKIVEEENPEYLGIVFDTGKPTLRHEAYKEYKAQRRPMPEDLTIQIPVLKQVIQAMRIPLFEYPDYEADDVLATLTRLAVEQKIPVVIVTTDKDLLQVVGPLVAVFNPAKEIYLVDGQINPEFLKTLKGKKIDQVENVFGVRPGQVTDVLTLQGDSSDNVPGVPGIGEKTARNLILEFGSLNNLKQNLDRVKNPKIREALKKNLELLDLSEQLVRVEDHLNLGLELEKFRLSEPDQDTLFRLYQELEFTSLISQYVSKNTSANKKFSAILTREDFIRLLNQLKQASRLALDTETTSLYPTRARLVGISFCLQPGEAYYLPLRHSYPLAPEQLPADYVLSELRSVLENPALKKIGQNIKYDYIVLKREGLKLQGISHDTMVLSYLLEPNWGKHSLDKLAAYYLREAKLPFESLVGKGKKQKTIDQASIEKVTEYSCQDAHLALKLSEVLWPEIEKKQLARLYEEIERPLIEVLAEMEIRGIKVDLERLRTLSAELEKKLRQLEKQIYEMSGQEFNLNSPQQLSQVLFYKLNLPASKKTRITKGLSTATEILEELAPLHPLAGAVLEYRQLAKLKSTYTDSLIDLVNPETGRVHTSYNQTIAATGRLSSSDPNLQNIPARGEMGKKIREAFIPEEGHLLLSADYAQIELRLLAHLSGDPVLQESFRSNLDIHLETARRVFGPTVDLFPEEMRRRAKIINFSIIYGTSAFSLAKELETSTAEAQKFIDLYFQEHQKVKEYLDKVVAIATEKGYAETIFGRKRPIPELKSPDKNIFQAGRRMALNTPIQGSAADIIKLAMVNIYRQIKSLGLKTNMILQVHDELVFEVPEKEKEPVEKLVKDNMENVCSLSVPLKVHLGWGSNWAEVK
ncbi:MAG TPA: DNA polymerase I [Candidatus Aminicenantes bacterium]|nr:MAG: DNA polymerase I [Candidatus Aminicenantes bacterium]HEK85528.1 DNA polymerase I [Candidatus Aminicenantes bacterium]